MGNSFLRTTFCAGWIWLVRGGRREDSAVGSGQWAVGSGQWPVVRLCWPLAGSSGALLKQRSLLRVELCLTNGGGRPSSHGHCCPYIDMLFPHRHCGAISCRRFRGVVQNLMPAEQERQ